MQRIGDMELDQDLKFEERQWTRQRVGWVVMALIVVAALLGLFGTGPLSAASVGDETTFAVDYQRFVRRQGQGELTVQVGPNQAREGEIALWLSTAYLGEIGVQGISPEPDEVRSAGDRRVYVFLVDDPAQPLEVSIGYIPQEMGRFPAEIGLVDGPEHAFTQISYP